MFEHTVSVGQLLSIPHSQPATGGSGSRAHEELGEFKERIQAEVKGIRWPAAMPDFIEKLAQLLDVPLPDIMIEAWRKSEEVRQVLDESRESPREPRFIDLLEHTISADFHPKIEIHVGRALKKTVEFVVAVTLTLKGAKLRIQSGEIREIRPGSCDAEGSLKYQDLTIAEKKLGTFELPEVIPIGRTQ